MQSKHLLFQFKARRVSRAPAGSRAGLLGSLDGPLEQDRAGEHVAL